jgi:hypothetical protein
LLQDLQLRIQALSHEVIIHCCRHRDHDAKDGNHDEHDLYFDWENIYALVESMEDLAMTHCYNPKPYIN